MKFSDLIHFKKNKKISDQTDNFVANPNRNYHVIVPTLKWLFFFLIILVPVFVFSYIVYNSQGLNDYIKFDAWNHMDVPNGHRIFWLLWAGYAFLIITVIGFCSFGIVVKNTKIKYLKTTYAIGIILFAIIGLILVSLSQYSFSKFYQFFQYEGMTTNTAIKYEWAQQLSSVLSKDWNNTSEVMGWEPAAVVWWVMFVQISVVFAIGVSLQNSMFSYSNEVTDLDRYIDVDTNDDSEMNFSKVDKFLKGLFSRSDKNIAILLIVVSIIIVIPNLVYAILISVDSTNLGAMISWGYKVPVLIQDINGQTAGLNPVAVKCIETITNSLGSNYYGGLFETVSLQIIFVGITVATSFFFVAITLRGRNISSRIFVFQSSILFVELIATIGIATASKIDMHHMNDFWTTQNSNGLTNSQAFFSDLSLIMGKDFDALQNIFPQKGMVNSSFGIEWLSTPATIAETIVAIVLVFGIFTIITYDIYKLGYFQKKNSGKRYTRGILNS